MLRVDRVNRASRGLGWLACAGFLVCVGVAGCGDSAGDQKTTVYPVTGKVTLPDGKPLESGRIVFVSQNGKIATGTVGSGGSYTLNSGISGEGAPPGEYKVRLEADESKFKQLPKTAKPGTNFPFPVKYSDEDSSQLKATVKPEPENKIDFKLDNEPPAKAAGPGSGPSKVRD